MNGGFSQYLEKVARQIPEEAGELIKGDLNLTLLDWYTDGVRPGRGSRRADQAVGGLGVTGFE